MSAPCDLTSIMRAGDAQGQTSRYATGALWQEHASSVESLGRLGRRTDMKDDSVESFFQFNFYFILREAL